MTAKKSLLILGTALLALWLSLDEPTRKQLASPLSTISKAAPKSSGPSSLPINSPAPEAAPAWLAEEARRMNQTDSNPKETEARLQAQAEALNESQIQSLAWQVLNTKASANERLLALYLLRLNRNTPSEAFEKIALLEEFMPAGHHEVPFETALAFSALEEIQLRSLHNRREIARLVSIAKQSRNPKVASISPALIKSAQMGRPHYLEVR